jgi:hypothetical protein
MEDIKSKKFYTDKELQILIQAKNIISPKKVVYFRDIIKYDTGYDIVPMSEKLKDILTFKCEEFIKNFNKTLLNNTHSKFGWFVEDEFKKFSDFKTPKGKGYPDYELPFEIYNTSPFIENKVFNKNSLKQSLRTFYYNSSSKINRTTNHILIGFEFEESNNKKLLTGNYHIIDLYHKKMRLRLEINCSNIELYE